MKYQISIKFKVDLFNLMFETMKRKIIFLAVISLISLQIEFAGSAKVDIVERNVICVDEIKALESCLKSVDVNKGKNST